jgi:uncharacterized protein YfaS (alpha-2-macroglobulin family)
MKPFALIALSVLSAAAMAAPALALTVVKAGPVGEIANMAEAAEVRVVFSEPMVVLGRIPEPLTAPFFHISPDVPGSFRWAGTTTLIFTPDPRHPLPFSTTFTVAIDSTAKSVAGHPLDAPYSFSFSTPTIKLLSTNWYRKGERYTGPLVIGLRFNQPVDPKTIANHLKLRLRKHEPGNLTIPASGAERLKKVEPQALAGFDSKVQAATQAASAVGLTLSSLADQWDARRIVPGPDLAVFETRPGIPPDSWIEVLLDDQLVQASGNRRPSGGEQSFIIKVEPTFFVTDFECTTGCDPDGYNAIRLRSNTGVKTANFVKAVTVTDITDPQHETVVTPSKSTDSERDNSSAVSLDEIGYSLQPAHTYLVRVDPSLEALDGQRLGYTWMGTVENWHKRAFLSFGSGHGVWEPSGGTLLPFLSRNFRSANEWLTPLAHEDLVPAIVRLEKDNFTVAPKSGQRRRDLAAVADKTQAYGLDIKPILTSGYGLGWAALQGRERLAKTRLLDERNTVTSTIVQVTNLGISVKDSPQNTLVLVTRLDDAQPVPGATVTIRTTGNKVFWSGTTDQHGIAIAPETDLRRSDPPEGQKDNDEWDNQWRALSELHFVVTAEKDGDFAYLTSLWHEGISPWDFELNFNISEARPLLRGTIFADRGVYKPGEEVHLKAIVRSDTPKGMQLLDRDTKIDLRVLDSHSKEVDHRTVSLSAWSSAEWTWTIPPEGSLGNYNVTAKIAGVLGTASGEFLVAAYRRPDFRVDVTLTGEPPVAGAELAGRIEGRYLFGGAMGDRDVKWSYSKSLVYDVPAAVTDRFPAGQFAFLGWDDESDGSVRSAQISSETAQLDEKGLLELPLETQKDAGRPYDYTLEGEVTDVSRQKIAGRASITIHPAPWYIGVKQPSYFAEAGKGIDTEIIAPDLRGTLVAGVEVTVTLSRIQWNSVRQAEGNGFYSWQTTRRKIPAGEWKVTTTTSPVALHIPVADGGEYQLVASASDGQGRSTKTYVYFYAVGAGYTAWARYDHNRIDLVPERATYKPGDSARIMIKSPWDRATALLTTEREGVRTSNEFELTSTQQTVTVPILETDIPNVFVSVLLVKGRTTQTPSETAGEDEESDPGKPSFRLGYVELKVEDARKRLKVDVKANKTDYRPASKARIDVDVHDVDGKPAASEVTLWAVDYGVLSLTGYHTPDVLESIYLNKALQVVNEDSRQRIISRRVLTPKGAGDGGGGGRDAGPGTIRKDFRVLAFWLGSLQTDERGHAQTEVALPESMTTYRIMAVAADKQSRFGWRDTEIRVSKPVLLTAAFPRFLAVGDAAYFGAVVHSQLKKAGRATVTIKNLDPSVLEISEPLTKTIDVGAAGAAEARFQAKAKSAGTARLQLAVKLLGETDAFEDSIPVRVLFTPETVAAYGEARPDAREVVEIPAGVEPSLGGLHLELSSTAMVGLGEGARYLVTYPYGCAEQRSSAALALMLVSDLGAAFPLPGIEPATLHATAQKTVTELEKFQCENGGFAFWPGQCSFVSPYVTSWVVHVMQRAKSLDYQVDAATLDHAYKYLDAELAKERPTNEGWMPAYTAWQAFAVKVLAEGGRNEDSNITRLYGYIDRMPIFGLALLEDAMLAKGEKAGARITELQRRIDNSILPEAGSAHVEELNDPYLLWFWNSNVRSTAIVLGTQLRGSGQEQTIKQMVRWLLSVRKDGRWENTQENAWTMDALVDYYRKFEREVPDFTAVVTLGGDELAKETFKGRSTESRKSDWTMAQLLARGPAGRQLPAEFHRQGIGTLFYLMRLKYAVPAALRKPLNAGFDVSRQYHVAGQDSVATSFKAGDLIEVTITMHVPKERRFVAVTDPVPAGCEPVEAWFATTSSALAQRQSEADTSSDWTWWERGGFDYIERRDDRVNLFATRLAEGEHEYTYLVRATTAGTFTTAPTHAEEMYTPEIFGRAASEVIEVKP